MRLTKIVLVALFCSWAGLQAQSTQLGGYVKFFAHPNLNKPYPFDRLGSRIQLKLQGPFAPRASFFAALDFNFEETQVTGGFDEPRSKGMAVYPVEAYVDLFFSKLDLRLGKQFIFWGKTDWINPTDNINPWDYVNIAAEIEDYRIPVTAAKADLYLGKFDLEAVWVPRFQPHKIPLHLPDSINGLPVIHQPTAYPANELGNSQFGFRLLSSFSAIDFSLSYFHGFDQNPTIYWSFQPRERTFSTLITYKPYQVFGADFVTTRGKFAFKGEGAYFLTEDRDGRNIFIKNPYLQYVLGIDYNATNSLTLNGQFIQTIRFKYDREYEISQREAWHMPTDNIPEQFVNSISLRGQYQVSDFVNVQVISVVNLKDYDYFLLPILNYSYSDGVNIYAGATLFEGPSRSTFGRNKAYSRAFVEVKYSF